MTPYVLDTSVLIRLYVPDGPLPPAAEPAVEGTIRGDAVLLVPELALAEAAQVLRKKERASFLSADEADEILRAIMDLPLDVVGHRELLPSAVMMSRTYGLTVYDGLFLALAARQRAKLLSADEALLRAWSAEVDTRHPIMLD